MSCLPQPPSPGKPPLWTPQAVPSRLPEDSGSYFRDKNAARYPEHPMEPAVVASLAADPNLPARVDLVACASTLGNLLRFVCGEPRTFRMLVYKVRDTVFLVHRENSPTELIPHVRGFGHTFPEANTTWEPDVRGSASHQRVIRYEFGGLDLLVRFEADGYIKPSSAATSTSTGENHGTSSDGLSETTTPTSTSMSTSTTPPSSDNNSAAATTTTLDTLTTTLSNTVLSPSTSTTTATDTTTTTAAATTPALRTIPAGALVPHGALFELKTRSVRTRHARDHVGAELPRLWVRQLPTLVLAFHDGGGLFAARDVEAVACGAAVREWERSVRARGALRRLAALLCRVCREVGCVERGDGDGEGRKGKGKRIEICHLTAGSLEVRTVCDDVPDVLSPEVRARWERGGEEEGGRGDGKEQENGNAGRNGEVEGFEWDAGGQDFTACSEVCGYCGKCTY